MDIQSNKNQAALVQRHLADEGIKLKRSSALNLVAKLGGYRSHTVAARGKSHASKPVKPVLFSGQFLHPEVQASYVAAGGKYCPYCGSHELVDNWNASPSGIGWDVEIKCMDCSRTWFAVYELESVSGIGLPATAVDASRNSTCPKCASDDLDYGTFVAGEKSHQQVRCMKCAVEWTDVYRLAELAESEDERDV